MSGLPAPRLLEADDATFECVTAGSGGPSVVLISGAGGTLEGWFRIFPALSEATTTFAYNRPGLGRSTVPLRPQTASVMVEDLRHLLVAASVPRPWVLVGHSFGGLVANLFARRCPQDVGGIVLLEATAPDDVVHLRRFENRLQRGIARVVNRLFPLHPHHETLHVSTSVSEITCSPAFPPLPLRVVSGIKPAMAWASDRRMLALRARHQVALARLSPLGKQIQAVRSGHFPQLSEPLLVSATILELVAAAR